MANKTSVTPAQVRAWAKQNGVSVGSRGRLDPNAYLQYLSANPADARTIASQVGITLPKRGRLSAEQVAQVAVSIV